MKADREEKKKKITALLDAITMSKHFSKYTGMQTGPGPWSSCLLQLSQLHFLDTDTSVQ